MYKLLSIFKNKWFKFFVLSILLFSIAVINDLFIRTSFPLLDRELRYIDHFLGAIFFCQLLFLISKEYISSGLIYFFACFVWEFLQFLNRGYFQIDQILVDLFSISIYAYIHISYIKLYEYESFKNQCYKFFHISL